MTDEQINAAIAKEVGWTQIEAIHRSGRAPGATYVGREFIPNYCTDLNAMHEAEKVLTEQKAELYFFALHDLAGNLMYHRATARQRAEAFLRTLGKWEANDKDSLLARATAKESSVVQGAAWPSNTRISRMNTDGKWEEVQG